MANVSKRLLSFVLVVMMVVFMMPATIFAADTGLSGTGTAEDPYLINNLDELIWFRDNVNTYTSDRSNQYVGKYVKLTADIDLDGINWTPIGTNSVGDHMAFMGTFDGDGHTISNLYINADGGHLGFFARTGSHSEAEKAVIKNLNFHNVDVSSNSTGSSAGSYVGGVIANCSGNTYVENVNLTGDIYVVGYGYVGGIVGHGYPKMTDCSVVADYGWVNAHYWCAGGAAGYAGEGSAFTDVSVSGLDVWGAYGAAAAVVGLANDDGSQVCELTNVSASDVSVSGADYYSGYIAGNGSTAVMNDIAATDVTLAGNIAATDAAAAVYDTPYFALADAFAAAKAGDTVVLVRDITLTEQLMIKDNSLLSDINLDGNGYTIYDAVSGASTLCFGADGYWATGVTIIDLTVEAAEGNEDPYCAIRLYGGTSSVLTNVNVIGDYTYGINFYGTHGATLNDCNIASAWTNGQAAYPLQMNNSTIGTLWANAGTDDNAKVFLDEGSSIETLYAYNSTKMIDSDSLQYIGTVLEMDTEQPMAVKTSDGTMYATLDAALDAAKSGDTVTLLTDITINGTWNCCAVASGVTINGDGHTLKIANVGHFASNAAFYGSNYNVQDLTIEQTDTDAAYSNAFAMNGGKATNVTVNGTFGSGIVASGGVVVENCTFNNTTWGIYAEAGNTVSAVTGCIFNSLRAVALYSNEIFADNTVNGDKGLSVATANATITGNTFTGERAMSISDNINGTSTITGNKFLNGSQVEVSNQNSPVLSENYWSDGYAAQIVPDGDATIGVSVGSYYTDEELTDLAVIYEAEINGVQYPTFREALAAAKDGDTITILNDFTLKNEGSASTFTAITKDITVDLNGKTIQGTGHMFRIEADVTFKNGTVDSEWMGYTFRVGNGVAVPGNLTIESGTYIGQTHTIYVSAGTATILGGDFSVVSKTVGTTQLINCYDANYDSGAAKVEIKGGTFHGFNPMDNAAEGADTNFCATGYITEDDGSGNYTAKGPYAVKVGDAYYETLDAALDAAKSGETVQLLNDAVLDMQIIKSGVTLDLNGKNLTAYYLMAVSTGANIIDSTDGEGSVTIKDDGSLELNSANAYMVLSSGNVYSFVKASIDSQWFKNNNTDNKFFDTDASDGSVKVSFALGTENDALAAAIADGGVAQNIKVRVKIAWKNAVGEDCSKYYCYTAEDVATYASDYQDNWFWLTITGTADVTDLTVTAEVVRLDSAGDAVVLVEDTLLG